MNFKKLRPRIPKLKESKVLEELQKISTADPPRVQELKHTSTFLQKPQRPAPPSKIDLDKQSSDEGEQYRVVIKKQQKKSVTERLLERGLLEPREDQTPEPPIEVKTYTPGCNRRDDEPIVTPIREISLLQVIPRVREIKVVQDLSPPRDRSQDGTVEESIESPQTSGPNMRELLKLLDSVQSLEALLLRKCARREDAASDCETSLEIESSPGDRTEDKDTDDNGDTSTMNYTPWCNAFRTEVQLEVPSSEVFAEFTVNIGRASGATGNSKIVLPREDISEAGSNSDRGVTDPGVESRDRAVSGGIRSISMPNVRKARKRRMRIRYLKSRLAADRASRERKVAVPTKSRVRYLENYLSRNIASCWGSLKRFVDRKRARNSSAGRAVEIDRSCLARAVEINLEVMRSGKNYLRSIVAGKEDGVVDLREPPTRSSPKRLRIRVKGRYVEKMSRFFCSYGRSLITRKNPMSESNNSSLVSMDRQRSNVLLDAVADLVRSCGCFVKARIFSRGGRIRSLRKWRNATLNSAEENYDLGGPDSISSVSSETFAISQAIADDRIYEVDGEDDAEEDDDDYDKSDMSRSSSIPDILNTCSNDRRNLNFAKLAACALVPFTSIMLLYVYK